MTPNRHGSAVIELPNELDVVMTRKFDAPIALVFDVLTKAEHVEQMVRSVFVPGDGVLNRPTRRRGLPHGVRERGRSRVLVPRHLPGGRAADPDRRDVAVEGWPDAHAVETVELREAHGVTTMTSTSSFRDQAGRDHMTTFDGQEDSYDKMEDLLRSLLDREGCVSG